MIAEAIQKISYMAVEAAIVNHKVIEVDGKKFWASTKQRIDTKDKFDCLKLKTLDGLIDFLTDTKEPIQEVFIHVHDFENVFAIQYADDEKERNNLILSSCDYVKQFLFNKWMGIEEMIIGAYSLFEETEDTQKLIQKISSLKIENSLKIEDDGSSMSKNLNKGVKTQSEKIIFELAPYRTFREIEPVKSKFIFRIDSDLNCALFEADGGAWKIKTMRKIKEYLSGKLPNTINIIC